MDSGLLLKFIGYFPDYLSELSTTFVETAVCHERSGWDGSGHCLQNMSFATYLGKDYKTAFLI